VLETPMEALPTSIKQNGYILDSLINFIIEFCKCYPTFCIDDNDIAENEEVGKEGEDEGTFYLAVHKAELPHIEAPTTVLAQKLSSMDSSLHNFTSVEDCVEEKEVDGIIFPLRGGGRGELLESAKELVEDKFHLTIIPQATKEAYHITLLVLKWLSTLADTGDGMCFLISSLFTIERMIDIMSNDPSLPDTISLAYKV